MKKLRVRHQSETADRPTEIFCGRITFYETFIRCLTTGQPEIEVPLMDVLDIVPEPEA